MRRRIYYITSEMTPFMGIYSLAKFSRRVTTHMNEIGEDIRVLAPRYGHVSPRKYIMREVIRLREIPVEFDEEDINANIRSAFIPDSKVQVYFLDHDAFYSMKKTPLIFKSGNGRPIKENPSRFTYLAKVTLTCLEHLFWKPELLVSHDFHGAILPVLHKELFAEDDYCNVGQTMLCIHEIDAFSDYQQWPRAVLAEAGLPEVKIEKLIGSAETFDVLELGLAYADHITIISETPQKLASHHLLNKYKRKKNFRMQTAVDSDENWETIAQDFHQICISALE